MPLLAGAITLACLTAPAIAQIHVYIGSAPPPMRREVRAPMPGPGYIWTDGYWGTSRGRYVWMPGQWQRAPYEGATWHHPHYDHYQRGWQVHEGHWDRDNHDGPQQNEQRHDDRNR